MYTQVRACLFHKQNPGIPQGNLHQVKCKFPVPFQGFPSAVIVMQNQQEVMK